MVQVKNFGTVQSGTGSAPFHLLIRSVSQDVRDGCVVFLRPLTQSIQEAAGQTEVDGGWTFLVGLGASFGHDATSSELEFGLYQTLYALRPP